VGHARNGPAAGHGRALTVGRHSPAGPAAAELRQLAAFANRGGPGTPAAGLVRELVEAAELGDTQAVRRLAEKAGANRAWRMGLTWADSCGAVRVTPRFRDRYPTAQGNNLVSSAVFPGASGDKGRLVDASDALLTELAQIC
jgi:hypothetical protein